MNEKIGSKVTLLKCGNKGSVMWVVTPIPRWLRKRLNMDIYRLRISLWVRPQGVPQFYEQSEHLHAYGSTTRARRHRSPASPRPNPAGPGLGTGTSVSVIYTSPIFLEKGCVCSKVSTGCLVLSCVF